MALLRRAVTTIVLAAALSATAQDRRLPVGPAMPPLPKDPKAWVGGPQSWASLKGKVVLIDVWAFGCVNCVNTIPWVKGIHKRYTERGVAVIGVHSPEFGFEKKRASLLAELKKHDIRYPQLVDNDSAYWNALGTQYWPTTYLVDRCGRLRARHIGEVREAQFSGDEVEGLLETLLAEKTSCS